jgi:hypothetical protein
MLGKESYDRAHHKITSTQLKYKLHTIYSIVTLYTMFEPMCFQRVGIFLILQRREIINPTYRNYI